LWREPSLNSEHLDKSLVLNSYSFIILNRSTDIADEPKLLEGVILMLSCKELKKNTSNHQNIHTGNMKMKLNQF